MSLLNLSFFRLFPLLCLSLSVFLRTLVSSSALSPFISASIVISFFLRFLFLYLLLYILSSLHDPFINSYDLRKSRIANCLGYFVFSVAESPQKHWGSRARPKYYGYLTMLPLTKCIIYIIPLLRRKDQRIFISLKMLTLLYHEEPNSRPLGA